jgi:hypothetical protein
VRSQISDDDIPFPFFVFLFGVGGEEEKVDFGNKNRPNPKSHLISRLMLPLQTHTQSIIKPAALAITQQIK